MQTFTLNCTVPTNKSESITQTLLVHRVLLKANHTSLSHTHIVVDYVSSLNNVSCHWIYSLSQTLGFILLCTYINDGVSLDVLHVGVVEAELVAAALRGADDPCCDGVLQRERAADSHHELARPQVRGAAQRQDRQSPLHGHKGKLRCHRYGYRYQSTRIPESSVLIFSPVFSHTPNNLD